MTEGKTFYLENDGNHRLFKVKYDEMEREIEKISISRGHKMTWKT